MKGFAEHFVDDGSNFEVTDPALVIVDMLNDFYLGLSVVALGLVIWLVILLVKDPRNVLVSILTKKS